MVGVVKKRILNRKRTNLAVPMKKQKKMRRMLKPEETPAPAPSPEVPETVEDVVMEGDGENVAKKTPIVREGKIRRTDMPLKVDYQSRKTQKANKHTNVIHRQPLSKKKFNKLQKAKRRADKEKEEAANKME